MIGEMISKVRKEKGMTKTELARLTDINIGHLTHIEKGERNPSHKTLKSICKALGVPYQQLMFTYDKTINEEQESYNVMNHIAYNKVLAIDSIGGYIDCPPDVPNSAIAIKVQDDAMSPFLNKDTYVFLEFNTPLNSKEIGLFNLNGQILLRRFIVRKGGKIILRSDNKTIEDINVTDKDSLYIIGKIYK